PKQQLEQETKDIEATQGTIRQAFDLANRHLVHCRLSKLRRLPPSSAVALPAAAQPATSPPTPIENPAENLRDLARQAVAQLDSLRRAKSPHVFIAGKPWGMSGLVWLAFCGAAYAAFNGHGWIWLVVGTIAAIAVVIAGGIWLHRKAVAAVTAPYEW